MKYSKVAHIIVNLILVCLMVAIGNSQMLGENDQDSLAMSSNLNELLDDFKNAYPGEKIPYYKLKLGLKQRIGNGNWDNIIRNPETKRQQRYRQCYFNPISCFRK